jgi:two-component system, OmpR family, sensor histidine kinase ResE
MEQVLRNLVGNALRYSSVGGEVGIECSLDGGQPPRVIVRVHDSGSGISREDVPHVFERFYRGDKTRSRAGGGAGLGLAIARHLIEAHGGDIGVTSEPENGTTFWFTLPV